jgi:hypothetical protein
MKIELEKIKNLLSKNFNRRLFRKLRKGSRPLVVTCILPYLKFSCDFLSKSQLGDGSWSRDILTTSLAMQALTSFSNVVGKDSSLRNEINLGAEFLRNSLNSLSDKVLHAKDLYGGLDKIAVDFGNATYTLWLTKSLRDNEFLQKVLSAFLKIEENVAKFIRALNNVEVTCSILNCHVIPSFPPPPEPILDFAINQLLSKDISPREAFLLIITLKNLETKFLSLLNERWNFNVKRRTDEWKAKSLKEGLEEIMYKKIGEILNNEKTGIATISYCLIGINRLNIKSLDIQEKIIERLLDLFNKINVWKGELSISDLSLFIWSISESSISKIAFFPAKESNYIINAVKWFEGMRTQKIKLVKSSIYHVFIIFISGLILLIAILSYMTFSDLRITLSILAILLSTFYFLLNWLSR